MKKLFLIILTLAPCLVFGQAGISIPGNNAPRWSFNALTLYNALTGTTGAFSSNVTAAAATTANQVVIKSQHDLKENLSNKQNSLATDGTGNKYPTVDAVNKVIAYVTPGQFEAVGNGVADDKVALQNAINSGKPVHLDKNTYYISGTINIPDGTVIIGGGGLAVSNIKITANVPAFSLQGNNITISDVSFIGTGKAGTYPSYTPSNGSQHAIYLYGDTGFTFDYNNIKITNCTFNSMGGAGVYIAYNGASFLGGGVQVDNCYATDSWAGFFCDGRGEFNTFSNCKSFNNTIGYYVNGGNNTWSGGILSHNSTNLLIGTGGNDGHGVITGALINHATDFGIWANGTTLGFTIANCTTYSNDIFLKNANGIKFNGGDISVSNIYTQAVTKSSFTNIYFATTPVFNLNWNGTNNSGTASDIKFFNPKFVSTSIPAGIMPNFLDGDLSLKDNTQTIFTNNISGLSGDINVELGGSGNKFKVNHGDMVVDGNLSAALQPYSGGTNLPVVYNSFTNRFETGNGRQFLRGTPPSTLVVSTDYVAPGAGTYTLPVMGGVIVGSVYSITVKNQSASSTITINAGSGEALYTTTGVGFISLTAGQSVTLVPDGVFWNIVQ
jgi:hypothetical protein